MDGREEITELEAEIGELEEELRKVKEEEFRKVKMELEKAKDYAEEEHTKRIVAEKRASYADGYRDGYSTCMERAFQIFDSFKSVFQIFDSFKKEN